MGSFCLVHGAWHGGWCWDPLVRELEQLGHRTTAVDLPCDDPAAAFSAYAQVVDAALDGLGEDVVLVAHSLGGLTVPLVAARRPVRHLVLVCALLAAPGKSLVQQLGEEPEMLRPRYLDGLGDPDEHGRTRWVDRGIAHEVLYSDCDEAVADTAFAQLRPQARVAPYSEPADLPGPPAVPTTYVLCEDDQLVDPGWARRAVPSRLGIEPTTLPGGHSPFLSRPAALAAVLDART